MTRFEFLLGSYTRSRIISDCTSPAKFSRRGLTFPGLSIGSSSSCPVAFALPLALFDSEALGVVFDAAAGFEKTLADDTDLAEGALDVVVAGFDGLVSCKAVDAFFSWIVLYPFRGQDAKGRSTYRFTLEQLEFAGDRPIRRRIIVPRHGT